MMFFTSVVECEVLNGKIGAGDLDQWHKCLWGKCKVRSSIPGTKKIYMGNYRHFSQGVSFSERDDGS